MAARKQTKQKTSRNPKPSAKPKESLESQLARASDQEKRRILAEYGIEFADDEPDLDEPSVDFYDTSGRQKCSSEPVRKGQRENRFERDVKFAPKQYVLKPEEYPEPTPRRPPVKQIKIRCDGCRRPYLIYPGDILPKVTADSKSRWLCNECAKAGR